MKISYKKREFEIPDAHPAANCLPWELDAPDFAALVESVKVEYDPAKPVLTQASSGLIISGRRRALACVIADVVPVMEERDWTDEQVISWVVKDELNRRMLTPTQRMASLVKLNGLNEKGTNQHSKDTAKQGKKEVPVSADTGTKLSRSEMAKMTGGSEASASRMAELKKTAPELLDAVNEGKLPVNTATRAAKELTASQVKKIANADDPKAEAKKLLAKVEKPEAKPAKPLDPCRGGNNFDFGMNATQPEQAETVDDTEEPHKPATKADLAAEFCKELEDTCRELDRLKARIEGWKANPLCYQTHWQSHAAQLEAVRKSIWQGRPQHVCPYCDGAGDDCKPCKGNGHVQRTTYKSGCEALGKVAA